MSLGIWGRSLLLVAALLSLGGWSFFDPFHKWVEKGNDAAAEGKDEDALTYYGEAAREKPSSPIPDFNSGIVHARQGEADPAKSDFLAAAASPDPEIAADALYNLGNVLLQEKDARGAVEAYLRSLDLDADDADARRNLELAVQMLEQQEQQPQQQEQQQQEQPKQDEQDEEGEQQQQQPDESPPNEEDSQNESPQADEDQQEEEEPEERELPPEERLSREDAERLLNAIESDELKLLEQLHDKDEPSQGVGGNDW